MIIFISCGKCLTAIAKTACFIKALLLEELLACENQRIRRLAESLLLVPLYVYKRIHHRNELRVAALLSARDRLLRRIRLHAQRLRDLRLVLAAQELLLDIEHASDIARKHRGQAKRVFGR